MNLLSLSISKFFVARLEGKIAGYGGYWWVSDEAHIVNLAVRPELRRQKIGEKILEHMTSLMKVESETKFFLKALRQS